MIVYASDYAGSETYIRPMAYVNGSTWSANGNSIAAAALAQVATYNTAVPIDDEIAGVTDTESGLIVALQQAKAALNGRKKVIAAATPVNDRDTELAAGMTGFLAKLTALAPYCDGFKLGCYNLALATWDRDLLYTASILRVAKKSFPHHLLFAEVWDKWQTWVDMGGVTHWDGGDFIPDSKLKVHAAIVAARCGSCINFDPTGRAAIYNSAT
jgi:hypothetical protein